MAFLLLVVEKTMNMLIWGITGFKKAQPEAKQKQCYQDSSRLLIFSHQSWSPQQLESNVTLLESHLLLK